MFLSLFVCIAVLIIFPSCNSNNKESAVINLAPVVQTVGPKPSIGRREGVPEEIRKTFGRLKSKINLKIQKITYGEKWEDSRAWITNGNDTRSYATGDLLPHGSLLVGIKPKSVIIFAADTIFVSLDTRGKQKLLLDYSAGKALKARRSKPSPGIQRTKQSAKQARKYKAAAKRAVQALASDDAQLAQKATDALFAAGMPVVEHLIPHVASKQRVQTKTVEIDGRQISSRTVGNRVIRLLEAITGQTFGNPENTELNQKVVDQWLNWWADDTEL